MTGPEIFQDLLDRGYPKHVAEAFMDSFVSESGLDPEINEIEPLVPGSRGGKGLYQLTGQRRTDFEAAFGGDWAPKNQLDWLDYELSGPERAAAEKIFSAPDRASAVRAITRDFLRPAKDNSGHRIGLWDRNKGVSASARANSAGVAADEGLGYKEMPFGIGAKAQAGLAEKLGGGKKMAGLGRGLLGLSQMLMDDENMGWL